MHCQEVVITDEVWADVPGFSDYRISNHGRVFSERRSSVWKNGAAKILHGGRGCDGYYRVKMVGDDGIKKSLKVHRLVCAAFHGEPSPLQVARHLDGNKLNNLAENLAWGSAKDNKSDSIAHGTYIHGERHHSNKLTEEQVLNIYQSSLPVSELAKGFGVSNGMVRHIKKRRKWRHILSQFDEAQIK